MKYFIIRLLENSNYSCIEVDYTNLDHEISCWNVEEIITEKDYMLFILSDDKSDGHFGSIHDFMGDQVMGNDRLIKTIKASKTLESIETINYIYLELYNCGVPFCMLEIVLMSIKADL